MSLSLDMPRVILKPGRESSIKRFHPWVFSGAIQRLEGAPGVGDRVSIMDAHGECLGFGHYSDGNIAVKILSLGNGGGEERLFRDRFREAVSLRERLRLPNGNSTTAFRLIHAEGDRLPGLIIDRYNDAFVVDCQSNGMEREQESICDALAELFGKDARIIFRSTEADKNSESVVETIRENGLSFYVDLTTGQKTGFFLDQRENRALCSRYAKARRVLNAFSYTGAFSVYALSGGATTVDSVDSSKPALELLRKNIELSHPGTASNAIHADCFDFFTDLTPAQYDLIVLDPPAFVKHRKAIDRGLRGYETVNFHALRAVAPGGIVFTFSCSQLIDRPTFYQTVFRAAVKSKRRVRILHELSQAPDHPVNLFHPEGAYLKGLVLEVQ